MIEWKCKAGEQLGIYSHSWPFGMEVDKAADGELGLAVWLAGNFVSTRWEPRLSTDQRPLLWDLEEATHKDHLGACTDNIQKP